VLLYAAAVALGYPELAVLATGCALAVIAGLAWTLPPAPLRVLREIAPTRVPRGDPAVAVVTVVNAGRRRRGRLRLVDVCGDGAVDVDVPSLPAGGRRTVTYRLPTRRRGEIAVGPLEVVRADPFGMARRSRPCGGRETLLVRPRVYALPMLALGRARQLEGSVSDTAPSGTVTFRALREYVPGDDLRHIHWRSSARLDTLMTRELVDASRPRTTIVLDVRPEAYGGDDARFELAVDAAASIAVAAGSRSFPVHILTTAGPLLETRGGRADAGALLDRLALVALQPGGTLTAAFSAVRRSRAAGLLVVVTGAPDPAELGGATSLRARFDRVVAVRTGPADADSGRGVDAAMSVVQAPSPEALLAAWHREAAR
jgi:uncharacterized protein (DUF58 family)